VAAATLVEECTALHAERKQPDDHVLVGRMPDQPGRFWHNDGERRWVRCERTQVRQTVSVHRSFRKGDIRPSCSALVAGGGARRT
jgi:hypothetical protein